MSDYIVWDSETAPESDHVLDALKPDFSAPSNYKDAAKIKENIKEQEEKWRERAALSPISGRVVTIGTVIDGVFECSKSGDEKNAISIFTATIKNHDDRRFIGWNIFGFDLPFLQKRAWKHGIESPIRHDFDSRRQDRFVDLMWLWANKTKELTSLNTAAKFLGVGEKNGDGKDFWKLWLTDQDAAIAYLKRDLELVEAVARKMGVIV